MQVGAREHFLRQAPEKTREVEVEDRFVEENKINWKEHSVLVLYRCLL